VETATPATVNSVPVFGATVKENETAISTGSSVAVFDSTVKEWEIPISPTKTLFTQSKLEKKKEKVCYYRFTSCDPQLEDLANGNLAPEKASGSR